MLNSPDNNGLHFRSGHYFIVGGKLFQNCHCVNFDCLLEAVFLPDIESGRTQSRQDCLPCAPFKGFTVVKNHEVLYLRQCEFSLLDEHERVQVGDHGVLAAQHHAQDFDRLYGLLVNNTFYRDNNGILPCGQLKHQQVDNNGAGQHASPQEEVGSLFLS